MSEFDLDDMKAPRHRYDDLTDEMFAAVHETEDMALPPPASAGRPLKGGDASGPLRQRLLKQLPMYLEYRVGGSNTFFSTIPDVEKLRVEADRKIPAYLASPIFHRLEAEEGALTAPLKKLQTSVPNFLRQSGAFLHQAVMQGISNSLLRERLPGPVALTNSIKSTPHLFFPDIIYLTRSPDALS